MAKKNSNWITTFQQKLAATSWSDWVISILLVVIIVAIVVWVQNDRSSDRNGISAEGFVDNRDRLKRHARHQSRGGCDAYMAEHFASGGGPPGQEEAEEEEGDEDQQQQQLPSGQPATLTSMKQLDAISSNDLVLLFIHHTQCGHCHTFQPHWKRLCTKYQNTRPGNGKRVTLYDISNEDNEALWNAASSRFNVEGYPTVMVLQHDGTKVSAQEYTGPREEFGVWCKYIDQQAVL